MSRKVMRAIPLVFVLCLASGAFAEISRDPNLVIYYSYEDVGTIVADESGKGHHGTVAGDVSEAPSGIKWYGAAQFQGVRGPTKYSYLDLNGPGFPAQDIPKSAITLAVWIKCQNTGGDHATLSARASDNTWIIHAEARSDSKFRWLLRPYKPDSTLFDMRVGTVRWDEWQHYTGTYDKTTHKATLYIDGEVVGEQNVTNALSIAGDWGTGARVGYNVDNARPFTGVMDEFYLFTRALSQAEITSLMVSDGLSSEKATHPWPGNGGELDSTATDLLWLPGAYAVSSDVYFGDRFEDVNSGTGDTFKGSRTEPKFTVSGLTWGKTYYWRIDSVNPLDPKSPWKGDVWSFLLRPQTAWNPTPSDGARWIDPNAVLSWSPGRGAAMHSVYFGDKFDDVNNATGAPQQTQTTYDPAGALAFEKVYYWRVDEFDGSATHKGKVWSFTTMRSGSGIKGEYYKEDFKTFLLARKDPGINFNWGAGSPDPQVPADNFSARWTGEFEVPFISDWTFTSNCRDWVRLWVNDQLLFDKWGQQVGVEWIGTINLAPGQNYSIVMEYYASTGEAYAQLYWNSPSWLSPYQPKQIIPQGAFSMPLRARGPRPANGAADVRDMPALIWTKGDTADKHDVYFGTDQAAVESATAATAGIYRGRQALDATTYASAEAPLQWGKTYYWRIDEVEADGVTIHKGNLWSFAVGEFFVVDDFESYNDIDPPNPASHTIFPAWIDGYSTPTTNGAIVGNSLPPYTERGNVHGGEQAMPLYYDNNFKFSEAKLTLTAGRDWTRRGVADLSLWFRGLATNAVEPMYVALNGTAVVYHTDPAAVQTAAWTEWVIPLQQFTSLGVDLTNVTSIGIGFGTRGNTTAAGGSGQMYFDDIRLYPLPQVPVENFSFELPGTSKQKGFDSVPGWHTDGPCADSGVETGYTPTDGSWTAYLMSGDPSVWQLTDHVIAAGDVLQLKVDARITWAATILRATLYYDDNGARVPVASQDTALSDAMREYTLSFSAGAVPASVGRRIGIEFSNASTGDTWIGLDNVRLGVLTQ